jgi:hypothetical protein
MSTFSRQNFYRNLKGRKIEVNDATARVQSKKNAPGVKSSMLGAGIKQHAASLGQVLFPHPHMNMVSSQFQRTV